MIVVSDTEQETGKIGINMAASIDLNMNDLLRVNNPAPVMGKRVIFPLPKNPADRATIVSVFPKEIDEVKPTIFPRRFVIPAAEKDGFSLLVLDGASYFRPSTIDRMPASEFQINAAALAQSIVDDYLNSTWLSSRGVRCPGIFWVPGEFNSKTILKYTHPDGRDFNRLLADYRGIQKNWFSEVMNAADAFWATTNGNPRSIPEDARIAASVLGVENTKPWMQNVVASQLENCVSCGEMINKLYPVCRYCHAVIDQKKATELGLTFASAK